MPHNPINQERRKHTRFPVRAYARLHHNGHYWETHLLDMSISGARLALLDEHLLRQGDRIDISLSIENLSLDGVDHQEILLHGILIHLRDHLLGIEYQPASETDKQLLIHYLSRME